MVIDQLANAASVSISQAPGRFCKLCAHAFPPSMSWLSDGVWLWPDDLIHYVEEHSVALPQEFLDRLLSLATRPVEPDPTKLDWPS